MSLKDEPGFDESEYPVMSTGCVIGMGYVRCWRWLCGNKMPTSVSPRLLGPVAPSFRAISGRLKFTARRHQFNKDSPSSHPGETRLTLGGGVQTPRGLHLKTARQSGPHGEQ